MWYLVMAFVFVYIIEETGICKCEMCLFTWKNTVIFSCRAVSKTPVKNGVADIFFVIFYLCYQLLINCIAFAQNLISRLYDISFYGKEMQYSHTHPNRPVWFLSWSVYWCLCFNLSPFKYLCQMKSNKPAFPVLSPVPIMGLDQ